jgi:D-aminoacyl-tRNA deacylase
MNLDIASIDGNLLLVSQFTLLSSTKKGNRPSFLEAARPEIAQVLYDKMTESLSSALGKTIATGSFGANMQINLVNDGPVTIIIDSKHPC